MKTLNRTTVRLLFTTLPLLLLIGCGNTKLLYVADDQVRSVADDGTGDRALGVTTKDSGAVWQPGRNGIVYGGEKTTSCDIFQREPWTATAGGSNKTSLTNGRCAHSRDDCAIVEPDVNGRGEIVAALRSGCEQANWSLVKMSPSGTNLTVVPGSNLRNNGRKSADPHWSPDGNAIVFENGGDLYTVPASGGTSPCRITSNGGASRPAWGTLQGRDAIAFIRNGDVHIATTTGTGNCPTYTVKTLGSPETETLVEWVTSLLAVVRTNGSGSRMVLVDPINNTVLNTLVTSNETIRDLDW